MASALSPLSSAALDTWIYAHILYIALLSVSSSAHLLKGNPSESVRRPCAATAPITATTISAPYALCRYCMKCTCSMLAVCVREYAPVVAVHARACFSLWPLLRNAVTLLLVEPPPIDLFRRCLRMVSGRLWWDSACSYVFSVYFVLLSVTALSFCLSKLFLSPYDLSSLSLSLSTTYFSSRIFHTSFYLSLNDLSLKIWITAFMMERMAEENASAEAITMEDTEVYLHFLLVIHCRLLWLDNHLFLFPFVY